MRKFIFITNEGCCEDPQGNPVENSQVLGYAGGEDAEDAFGKLKFECEWLQDTKFNEVFAFELVSENHKVFYLSDPIKQKK